MSTCLHVKYLLFLSYFNEIIIFSTDFRTSIKYQVLSISVHWEPNCSVRTDGQTDGHDDANNRFSQFCERAQKSITKFGGAEGGGELR
jgi:hypothetical protein